MKRRIISIITALALCLSLCPTWALAAEADPSLCKHHPAHTEDCGYIAPTEGHDCGHAHGDECYSEETRCAHVHDGSCYSDGLLPAEGEDRAADACAHVCSAESGCVTRTLDCQHLHDSACGYVQGDPGTPCGYACRICPIEDLIAALPEQVAEDNADDVRGQETLFYTLHFGQIDPQKLLDAATAKARASGTTVKEALQQTDYDLPEVESHVRINRAILGPGSKLAEKLSQLMASSPITAAHITMDADSGRATIEMNPLWEKLRHEREARPPARQNHSNQKRSSKHKKQPDR